MRWLVEELHGAPAVDAYLWVVGSEPAGEGWIAAPAEEPMWTRLRQTTSSRPVDQGVLPDRLLRPGGQRSLDTARRALLVGPDRRVAYYVWDGSRWRSFPPGDVRGALDRGRLEVDAMLRRLFQERYPPGIARVHVELFDQPAGAIEMNVFLLDGEGREVFVGAPGDHGALASLRELECTVSVAAAHSPGSDLPDVLGVDIPDVVVLDWLGEVAVQAGVARCDVQVTAGFHDDEVWRLGPLGARR